MAVRPRRLAFVLWPAFLMAGLLEMLVFAVVDPSDLHFGVQPVELSREAVYSMAFLAFWLLVTVACLLTALLLVEPDDPGGPGRRRPWP
ncbi:MAG: hypothetical protein JO369_08765 [Paucibacter sp.]|nr:hypothetical protein [Roseateles sp.]